MIRKLKAMLSNDNDDEPPRNDPTVRETVNRFADGDYYTKTRSVSKGDCVEYTVDAGFVVTDGWQYEAGDGVAGVLRPYDSVAIEENIRGYYADNGTVPVDNWTGAPEPSTVVQGIALVPGEFVVEADSSQYLAVPMFKEATV